MNRRAFLLGGVSLSAALAAGCGTDRTSETSAPESTRPLDPVNTTESPARAATSAPPDDPAGGSGPARFVVRAPADADAVALTFHTDGDLDLARQLLDVLDRHDAVATCFVVGDWLEANPSWADELVDAGLELANHTATHPTFARLSPEQMADEIGRCRDILVERTGAPGRLFRPSGTADGTTMPADDVLAAAGAAGYPTVLGWDVEPFDYEDPGATEVEARVVAGVTGGSVVSLHFGHPGTIDALDPILSGLSERGLRTVTASELLQGG